MLHLLAGDGEDLRRPGLRERHGMELGVLPGRDACEVFERAAEGERGEEILAAEAMLQLRGNAESPCELLGRSDRAALILAHTPPLSGPVTENVGPRNSTRLLQN